LKGVVLPSVEGKYTSNVYMTCITEAYTAGCTTVLYGRGNRPLVVSLFLMLESYLNITPPVLEMGAVGTSAYVHLGSLRMGGEINAQTSCPFSSKAETDFYGNAPF
jgi:hypothetical protein